MEGIQIERENAEILKSVQGNNTLSDNDYPWDAPANDVSKVAEKFSYGNFETEDFVIPYRFFSPETNEKSPLVIYLHGAGDVGNDNEKQLSTNTGIEFARKEWQKNNPC